MCELRSSVVSVCEDLMMGGTGKSDTKYRAQLGKDKMRCGRR